MGSIARNSVMFSSNDAFNPLTNSQDLIVNSSPWPMIFNYL